MSETVVGMEENLFVPLNEKDADRFGTAWADNSLIGPYEISARLRRFDLSF